jgi:hypothetical protein
VGSPKEISLILEGVVGHLEMKQPRFQLAAVRDAFLKQQKQCKIDIRVQVKED